MASFRRPVGRSCNTHAASLGGCEGHSVRLGGDPKSVCVPHGSRRTGCWVPMRADTPALSLSPFSPASAPRFTTMVGKKDTLKVGKGWRGVELVRGTVQLCW